MMGAVVAATAAQEFTSTPFAPEVAAFLGTIIVALVSGAGGLAVWYNRRVARKLAKAQAVAQEAEAWKFHADAARVTTQSLLDLLKEVERTAQQARSRALEAERMVRQLRQWVLDAERLMRAHGINPPPLPEVVLTESGWEVS